jgi:hypothetical protein
MKPKPGARSDSTPNTAANAVENSYRQHRGEKWFMPPITSRMQV